MQRREINRKNLFCGEIMYSRLTYGDKSLDVTLLNFSLSGFQVLIKNINQKEEFPKGFKAALEFSPNKSQDLRISGELVGTNIDHDHRIKLSFRSLSKSITSDTQSIKINPFFEPTGFFENPFRFLDIIYFKISGISSRTVIMITSARNSQIIPGLEVKANVFLPGIGQSNLELTITHSEIYSKNKDKIICVAKFSENNEFLELCVDWLLMSGSSKTLKDLSRLGFPVSEAVKGFEITYPSSELEMTQIMNLRLKAQQHEGRFLDVEDTTVMSDRFDSHSRHIIAKAGGRIVGATRLVFNNSDPYKTEHVPMGAKIPGWLWESGFVESSRSVTDPDYRGSDLFISMTRHMGRVVLQTGLRYMLFSCEDKLQNFYERSGAKFINYFVCPDAPKLRWTLMYMDVLNSALGKHGGLLNWSIVQAPMLPFVQQTGSIKPNLTDKVRLFFYRKFDNTAKKLYREHKRNRRKKTFKK